MILFDFRVNLQIKKKWSSQKYFPNKPSSTNTFSYHLISTLLNCEPFVFQDKRISGCSATFKELTHVKFTKERSIRRVTKQVLRQFLIWPCVCVRVQFSILVCLNGLIYCVQLSYMQHCDRKQIRVVRSIPLIFLCEKFFAWLNNSSSSILMNDVFWRVSFLRDYLFLFISIIPFCFSF